MHDVIPECLEIHIEDVGSYFPGDFSFNPDAWKMWMFNYIQDVISYVTCYECLLHKFNTKLKLNEIL